MDVLPTLAEVSVALAGFASVVVLFLRRESGLWKKPDAERFVAMVFTAGMAVFFSILPLVLASFAWSPERVWGIGSALLGVSLLGQTALAIRAEIRRSPITVAYVGSLGLLASALQLLNFGLVWQYIAGPYVAGVAWLTLQSLTLFGYLVRIPEEHVEEESS